MTQTSGETRGNRFNPSLEMRSPAERRAALASAVVRRRWAFRTTVMLSITAVALCFFVAWRRDRMIVQGQLDLLTGIIAELKPHVDQLGLLPAGLPEDLQKSLNYYASDADRYYVSKTSDAVIIAYTSPTALVLMGEGRAAIIFHNGKMEAKWMDAHEFDAAWADQEKRIEQFENERRAQPIILP
jgi:hypothetical protein